MNSYNSKKERDKINALIRKETVPSLGCTEPIAVALAVTKATELLGDIPETVNVILSANIIKNAMSVGIPGTGFVGLPYAIALGVFAGNSSYNLEVLKDIDQDSISAAKTFIADGRISINISDNEKEKLYIEAICEKKGQKARVIIAKDHTNFVHLSVNENVIIDVQNQEDIDDTDYSLTLKRIYDFALTSPIEEIEYMYNAGSMNQKAAEEALNENYGQGVAKSFKEYFNTDNIMVDMMSLTAAASEARMSGVKIPILSNSGSGNQGIGANVPVITFAKHNKNSRDELIRALILSNLTTIYIKQKVGRLSGLCGAVYASVGAACAITYLMGGNYEQIKLASQNTIANITGMICDGAKPGCALKLATGTSTAMLSAILAMENKGVTPTEGIIDNDEDKSIHNLAEIGRTGMEQTDKLILQMMLKKTS